MSDEIQSNVGFRYMVAGIGLSMVVIVAITAVTIFRPEHDNSGIITCIMAVGTGTYPGILAFIRGQANSDEVRRAKAEQDKKAEEIRLALLESQRKLTEVNDAQRKHLEQQDTVMKEQDKKLETVVRQTDGLIDQLKEKAHSDGVVAGEKAALQQLGIEPRRTTDEPKIKERE